MTCVFGAPSFNNCNCVFWTKVTYLLSLYCSMASNCCSWDSGGRCETCCCAHSGPTCRSCAPKRGGRFLNPTSSRNISEPVCSVQNVCGLLAETTPRRAPVSRSRRNCLPPRNTGDSSPSLSSCPPLENRGNDGKDGNDMGDVHDHLNSSPAPAAAHDSEPVQIVRTSDLTAAMVCGTACDYDSNCVRPRLADEELEESDGVARLANERNGAKSAQNRKKNG